MNISWSKDEDLKSGLDEQSVFLPHHGFPVGLKSFSKDLMSLEIDNEQSISKQSKEVTQKRNFLYKFAVSVCLFISKYKACIYAVLSSVWYAANVVFGKYAIKNNPKITTYDINFMRGIVSIFIMSYQIYLSKANVFSLNK